MTRKKIIKFGLSAGGTAGLIMLLVISGLGDMLNPIGGIWNGSLNAEYPALQVIEGSGHRGTVYRDELGIPHIFASTYPDMTYIMGYLQATDRLFAMDMEDRLISGRLSEILGPGAIPDDKFARILGFKRTAGELWERIQADAPSDPELQTIVAGIQAYCDGVNRYIADVTASRRLPFEYVYLGITPEPWDALKVLALLKYMGYMLSFSESDILMTMIRDAMGEAAALQLFPSTPYDFEAVVIPDFTNDTDGGSQKASSVPRAIAPSGEDIRRIDDLTKVMGLFQRFNRFSKKDLVAQASNNWVVNGSLTNTGKPILCNDPHLQLMMPSIWWEFQFVNSSSPAECVYGVSFPGTPVAEIGHTGSIAWGATVTGYDATDFYFEALNPAGTQFLFNGTQWRDIETVVETIKVAGQPDVLFPVRFTYHDLTAADDFKCPIIADTSDVGFPGYENISIKWTGFSSDYGAAKAFFRLNKAKNFNDYEDAMRVYSNPGQNFIYADIDGNIALYPTAKYPVRNATGTVKEGRFILNGSSGEDEWTGYIPFEWIPHKVNPSQMYLASANQRGVNTTDYTRYYIHYAFASSHRGRRINQLLQNESLSSQLHGTKVDVAKMRAFQADCYDVAAEAFVPILLDAVEAAYPAGIPPTGATALLNDTVDALLAWNASAQRCVMDKDLVAPTIFDRWLRTYVEMTLLDEATAAGFPLAWQGSLAGYFTDFVENITKHEPGSAWFDDVATAAETEDASVIMLRALNETVDVLHARSGPVGNWTWGRHHVVDVQYLYGMVPAFNVPPFAASGSSRTLNVAPGEHVQAGPSMRMIVDLAALENGSLYSGYLTVCGGQSGNPASSHYSDNLQLWKNLEYHEILFPRSIEAYPATRIITEVRFS
ncbi:MAG: penicillin acylase family protein [Candidatus Lokiarchaeota archaeon]|nr:penicillin acylase family protein [Candidatus Lokiarchaeota archaeon]